VDKDKALLLPVAGSGLSVMIVMMAVIVVIVMGLVGYWLRTACFQAGRVSIIPETSKQLCF